MLLVQRSPLENHWPRKFSVGHSQHSVPAVGCWPVFLGSPPAPTRLLVRLAASSSHYGALDKHHPEDVSGPQGSPASGPVGPLQPRRSPLWAKQQNKPSESRHTFSIGYGSSSGSVLVFVVVTSAHGESAWM